MTKNQAGIEHVNVTVADADASAAMTGRLFGWEVRWTGEGKESGSTVHVGTNDQYMAFWSPQGGQTVPLGSLNHVGVLVDDLDATEQLVAAEGFEPFNHGDYEPGRRFYFLDTDGIEWEVVSYR